MSIKIIKSAAAITCLTAMSAAAASSVSVYGVIDTGFGVSKGKGQAAKVQAISGGNAASRWGLKGQGTSGEAITLNSFWNKASRLTTARDKLPEFFSTGTLFSLSEVVGANSVWDVPGLLWERPDILDNSQR